MAKKTKKLTTFKSSETVVTDEYLNSLYGGLHGTDKEQFYSTLDPLVSGHVHDGEHADGHAQKIDLSKHVTGKLPKEFVSGTFDYFLSVSNGSKTIVADQPNDTLNVSAGDNIVLDINETTDTLIISSDLKPDAPNLSFQFNSADTFAGSETFIFNTIDRSVQISKDTLFRFGSIDNEYSFRIAHSYVPSPTSPDPSLNFYAPNTTESYITFSNFDFFQSSSNLYIRTDKESMYVYPISSVYDGDTSTTIDSQLGYDDGSETIFPWADVNSEELTLWNIAFDVRPSKDINYADSRYVALRANSDQQDNYTIYMPKYVAGTVNNILRVSSIPSSTEVEMTWDTVSGILGTTSFNNPGVLYALSYYNDMCTTTLSHTTVRSTCDMHPENIIGTYYVPQAATGGSLQVGKLNFNANSKLYVSSLHTNFAFGTTVDAILSYGTTHFNGNFFVNTTSEVNIFHSHLKQQTIDTSILERSLLITNNYTSNTAEDMPELKAVGTDSRASMRFTVHGVDQAQDDSIVDDYDHLTFPSYRFATDSEDPALIKLYTRDMTSTQTTSFVGIMPPIFDHLQENYILVLPDHVPATDDYVMTAKLTGNYGSAPFVNLQWEPRCCEDTTEVMMMMGMSSSQIREVSGIAGGTVDENISGISSFFDGTDNRSDGFTIDRADDFTYDLFGTSQGASTHTRSYLLKDDSLSNEDLHREGFTEREYYFYLDEESDSPNIINYAVEVTKLAITKKEFLSVISTEPKIIFKNRTSKDAFINFYHEPETGSINQTVDIFNGNEFENKSVQSVYMKIDGNSITNIHENLEAPDVLCKSFKLKSNEAITFKCSLKDSRFPFGYNLLFDSVSDYTENEDTSNEDTSEQIQILSGGESQNIINVMGAINVDDYDSQQNLHLSSYTYHSETANGVENVLEYYYAVYSEVFMYPNTTDYSNTEHFFNLYAPSDNKIMRYIQGQNERLIADPSNSGVIVPVNIGFTITNEMLSFFSRRPSVTFKNLHFHQSRFLETKRDLIVNFKTSDNKKYIDFSINDNPTQFEFFDEELQEYRTVDIKYLYIEVEGLQSRLATNPEFHARYKIECFSSITFKFQIIKLNFVDKNTGDSIDYNYLLKVFAVHDYKSALLGNLLDLGDEDKIMTTRPPNGDDDNVELLRNVADISLDDNIASIHNLLSR